MTKPTGWNTAKPFEAPFPEYFRSRRTTLPDGPAGGHWALTCRRCGARWALKVERNIAPGNLLHLLDHARSHDAQAERAAP